MRVCVRACAWVSVCVCVFQGAVYIIIRYLQHNYVRS